MAAGIIVTDTDTGPFAKSLGQGASVVAPSGDVTIDSSGVMTIGQVLDGANAANVAAANVIGGIPVQHIVVVPAGTTGDVDVVLTHKTRVTDVHLVKTTAAGGGAGTIQVKNGATAISNAMSIDIADTTIARATTIDDAAHDIAAGGTLRVTRTRSASTSEACIVYVSGLRVA
jgi:hypothetical protein